PHTIANDPACVDEHLREHLVAHRATRTQTHHVDLRERRVVEYDAHHVRMRIAQHSGEQVSITLAGQALALAQREWPRVAFAPLWREVGRLGWLALEPGVGCVALGIEKTGQARLLTQARDAGYRTLQRIELWRGQCKRDAE